ncbi:MAG: beta-galactosidase, partial [Planctomycetota bacterium]
MCNRTVKLAFVAAVVLCSIASGKLMSRWAEEVSADNVWPEYPRPQMMRKEWLNLNGKWEYAIRPKDEGCPKDFDGSILVPFCVESALS